ncbi:hypothetical protein [Bremerella alba]|uniref:Uncharacterized protein n=1 Tax=Bremerella alba TaxID=980252 RepID=A0A7V8V842_9BACT|nr:hypothetical protein [Bremerella alba]MBA2116714.1 hypothetical protein [Bremerella alba]
MDTNKLNEALTKIYDEDHTRIIFVNNSSSKAHQAEVKLNAVVKPDVVVTT